MVFQSGEGLTSTSGDTMKQIKEIRTKINQTAHLLAQREVARITMELTTLCEQLQRAGKSDKEIMQAIDKQASQT